MYKMMVRLRKSFEKQVIQYKPSEVEAVYRSFCLVIRNKLFNIKYLEKNNFLKLTNLDGYVASKSYTNVGKLVNDYLSKY